MGVADPFGAGAVLPADGETVGAPDEPVVGATVGDVDAEAVPVVVVVGVGVPVGVALGDVAGADEAGAAVGDVLGADVAGAEVAGELSDPLTACSIRRPRGWCAEVARAMPPAVDAASSPTTVTVMASGRIRRRRRGP